MQSAVRQLNVDLATEGTAPLSIGVGLHYGRVMVGTIREPERLDGTIISDAVNIASRLQDLTKTFGAQITLSSRMLEQLAVKGRFAHRYLGRIALKGRVEHVDVHEVLAATEDAAQRKKRATQSLFEAGVAAWMQDDFARAAGLFRQVYAQHPEDKAAAYSLDRSEG